MKLQQLVDALDAQILKGDFIGAFQTYAADNCVTFSNPQDKTNSKAQKLELTGWFLANIASINRIERPAVQVVGDEVTESEFVFDFTNRQGQSLVFNEVIRRTWKNGLIVEEQYLLEETIRPVKKSAAKTPAKKEEVAAKEVQPAAAKVAKTTAPKTTTVKAEPKAAAKSDKTKARTK